MYTEKSFEQNTRGHFGTETRRPVERISTQRFNSGENNAWKEEETTIEQRFEENCGM